MNSLINNYENSHQSPVLGVKVFMDRINFTIFQPYLVSHMLVTGGSHPRPIGHIDDSAVGKLWDQLSQQPIGLFRDQVMHLERNCPLHASGSGSFSGFRILLQVQDPSPGARLKLRFRIHLRSTVQIQVRNPLRYKTGNARYHSKTTIISFNHKVRLPG